MCAHTQFTTHSLQTAVSLSSRLDTSNPIILSLSRSQEQTQFSEAAARSSECTQITVKAAGS